MAQRYCNRVCPCHWIVGSQNGSKICQQFKGADVRASIQRGDCPSSVSALGFFVWRRLRRMASVSAREQAAWRLVPLVPKLGIVLQSVMGQMLGIVELQKIVVGC